MGKNSIKNLFDELLREKRGFKYIISVKINLKKQNNYNDFDPKTLYFNSQIKTVINWRYRLNESFEEIVNLLDIWINECFMWCHVRLINPANSHPERIKKQDKKTLLIEII